MIAVTTQILILIASVQLPFKAKKLKRFASGMVGPSFNPEDNSNGFQMTTSQERIGKITEQGLVHQVMNIKLLGIFKFQYYTSTITNIDTLTKRNDGFDQVFSIIKIFLQEKNSGWVWTTSTN